MPDTKNETGGATANPAPTSPVTIPVAFQVSLDRSTAATKQATEAVASALRDLPTLLAAALAQCPAAAVPDGAAAAATPAIPQPRDRELRDRRIPDFWEHSPKGWFVILDDHFTTATTPLTEARKFSVLLPLLTPDAVKKLSCFIASPPQAVYTRAKEALILHFERSKEDMIAELYGLNSLGDRSAVDFLGHMRSLQPGDAENGLFKYIFVKSLPKYVRGIVSHHDSLDDMAAAADVVLRTVPDHSSSSPSDDLLVAAATSSHHRDQLVGGLCLIHSRYGREAYHCALPDTCRMKNITRPRSPRCGRQAPSGNGIAGRQ